MMAKKKGFEKEKKRHASGESTLSSDSVSPYIPVPPDGGYGWVIVFASFMNHVIVDGFAFTFGVFIDDFTEYFGVGKARTAVVGSLMAGCYLLSAPLAGALVNKFGCRPVSMVGAVLSAFGFAISTLSPNIDVMMLTYGIIGGVGLGLLYLPNIVAVSYYFQRRRAFATGIAVCGAGVGCFVFAPLCKYLLMVYAWQSAMLIVSGITLNGVVFGALLVPLRPPVHYRKPRSKTFFDRLREKAAKQTKRKRSRSECSEDQPKILQKVQHVKLARERALSAEESDNSDVDDHTNNAGCYDNGKNKTSLKPPTITFSAPADEPSNPTVDPKQSLLGPTPQNGGTGDDAVMRSSDSKLASSRTATQTGGKFERNVTKPTSAAVTTNGGRYHSEICMAPTGMKLPRGVHKDDFARPLYRRDIFYSGSVLHVDKFHSAPNVHKYAKSVTSVPGSIEPERTYTLFHCIPISKASYDTLRQMTDLSLLKNPVFLIPCVANLFAAIGLFIPFVYIVDRATSLGQPPERAAFLISMIGTTNTGGRILAGFLADLKRVNGLLLHNVSLICAGLLCFVNMFCLEYVSMCVFAALFGLCIATWISLTSIVLCNLLGLEKLTNAFGLLTMTRGIAALIGSPLAGMVYDETQNYDNSFHVGGAMLLAGGLLLCLLHLPQMRQFAASADVTRTDSMSAELPVPGDEEKDHGGPRFSSDVEECDNEITLTVRGPTA